MFFVTGKLYDFIAGAKRGVPPSRIIPPDEALFQMPGLRAADLDGNALVGGLVIYDGQQNDSRMNLCIILSALQQGAVCANHVELEALLASGGEGTPLSGARVRDRRSGRAFEIRAKQVVNACGVFSDKVRQMAEPSAEAIMVPSYGTHLVLPEYAGSERMGMVWFTQDGRVLYLLPWEGSTIAGTTDTAGELSYEPFSTRADGDFILGECNRLLKEPLTPASVRASWAGIRPLVRKPGSAVGDTKSLSRDHVVETLAASGLVTIAGGKWTTYRKMAEDAVDACVARNPALRAAAPCSTLSRRLIGSDSDGAVCGGRFERITSTLRDDVGLDAAVATHLLANYGTRALQLVELARAEGARFAQRDEKSGQLSLSRLHAQYPHLEAEVAFACRCVARAAPRAAREPVRRLEVRGFEARLTRERSPLRPPRPAARAPAGRHEFAETAVDVLAHRTRLCFLSADAAREALPRVVEIMAVEKGWSSAHARRIAARRRPRDADRLALGSDTFPPSPRAPRAAGDRVLAIDGHARCVTRCT
jgi:glycerol-3-phosphate dehydrogenase